MHFQTHVMSGWCVGNIPRLSPRERLFCMVAAAAPDLDGLSWLFGQEAYWDCHHVLCHNLLSAMLVSLVLAILSPRRIKDFSIYFLLFHLHLLMDFLGSGECWTIPYLWPFSERLTFEFPYSWPLYSWQNILAGIIFLAWTIAIIRLKKRTPLEALMPSLDRQISELVAQLGRGKKPPAKSCEIRGDGEVNR